MMSAARSREEKAVAKVARHEVPEVPKGTPVADYPQRMNCATAAQLISVSYSHLRHRTAAGKCPAAIHHGKRVTYDKDMLLAWRPQ